VLAGLDKLFQDRRRTEVHKLFELIQELLGGASIDGRLLKEERLQKRNVYRLIWEINGGIRTFVVKQFSTDSSRIEKQAIGEWLPAVNLASIAPKLLGVAAEATTEYIWHVYEDFGDNAMDQSLTNNAMEIHKDHGFLTPLKISPDKDHIKAIVKTIANLHKRFQGHDLINKCRLESTDLGSDFLQNNVHNAIYALESLQPGNMRLSKQHIAVRDNLLDKLYTLRESLAWRSDLLKKSGGPDTLLHGDFGVKNAFVIQTERGLTGKLIDWDHAGVGPISYDLSTFLMQIPCDDRSSVLDLYKKARRNESINWPGWNEWNLLFETHEYARLANCVTWPAMAAGENYAEWAFDDLKEIDGWFEDMQLVLTP
jgi:thiamine kinase-like enzyme